MAHERILPETAENQPPVLMTVCFLKKEGKILLGKKTKKIGVGKWNGCGGKQEEKDYDLEDTAVRETGEEINVHIEKESLKKVAVMNYHNEQQDGTFKHAQVHFYIVSSWHGDPTDTDEIENLTWFDDSNLPFDDMLPSDRLLLPLILKGKFVLGDVWHDKNWHTIPGKVSLREVEQSELP